MLVTAAVPAAVAISVAITTLADGAAVVAVAVVFGVEIGAELGTVGEVVLVVWETKETGGDAVRLLCGPEEEALLALATVGAVSRDRVGAGVADEVEVERGMVASWATHSGGRRTASATVVMRAGDRIGIVDVGERKENVYVCGDSAKAGARCARARNAKGDRLRVG